MTDRELLKQALDALEYASDQTKPKNLHGCDCLICKTILALRDRLAQPKQEWVNLTYQEVVEIMGSSDWTTCWSDVTYTRAVEAKLKEKNT
jgi:hypothetical protein